MRRVERYETSDGALHLSARDAKRHTEKRYADLILRLSRELCGLNYTQTSDYLDAHLPEFVALSAIRADLEVTDGESDE